MAKDPNEFIWRSILEDHDRALTLDTMSADEDDKHRKPQVPIGRRLRQTFARQTWLTPARILRGLSSCCWADPAQFREDDTIPPEVVPLARVGRTDSQTLRWDVDQEFNRVDRDKFFSWLRDLPAPTFPIPVAPDSVTTNILRTRYRFQLPEFEGTHIELAYPSDDYLYHPASPDPFPSALNADRVREANKFYIYFRLGAGHHVFAMTRSTLYDIFRDSEFTAMEMVYNQLRDNQRIPIKGGLDAPVGSSENPFVIPQGERIRGTQLGIFHLVVFMVNWRVLLMPMEFSDDGGPETKQHRDASNWFRVNMFSDLIRRGFDFPSQIVTASDGTEDQTRTHPIRVVQAPLITIVDVFDYPARKTAR